MSQNPNPGEGTDGSLWPDGDWELDEPPESEAAPGGPVLQDDVSFLLRSRSTLTRWLLVTCVALSAAFFVTAWSAPPDIWQRFDGMLPLLFTPFVTLLATAVGHTFQSK